LEQFFGLFLVLDAAGVRGIAVLEPEFGAIGDAMRFGEAHRILDQFRSSHGASVVRAVSLEHWSERPAERGKPVVCMKGGTIRHRQPAVESQDVYRVVGAQWNADSRYTPLHLDAGGSVEDWIRRVDQRGAGASQPLWQEHSGADIEETAQF